jgi:hypothetical protein
MRKNALISVDFKPFMDASGWQPTTGEGPKKDFQDFAQVPVKNVILCKKIYGIC